MIPMLNSFFFFTVEVSNPAVKAEFEKLALKKQNQLKVIEDLQSKLEKAIKDDPNVKNTGFFADKQSILEQKKVAQEKTKKTVENNKSELNKLILRGMFSHTFIFVTNAYLTNGVFKRICDSYFLSETFQELDFKGKIIFPILLFLIGLGILFSIPSSNKNRSFVKNSFLKKHTNKIICTLISAIVITSLLWFNYDFEKLKKNLKECYLIEEELRQFLFSSSMIISFNETGRNKFNDAKDKIEKELTTWKIIFGCSMFLAFLFILTICIDKEESNATIGFFFFGIFFFFSWVFNFWPVECNPFPVAEVSEEMFTNENQKFAFTGIGNAEEVIELVSF